MDRMEIASKLHFISRDTDELNIWMISIIKLLIEFFFLKETFN